MSDEPDYGPPQQNDEPECNCEDCQAAKTGDVRFAMPMGMPAGFMPMGMPQQQKTHPLFEIPAEVYCAANFIDHCNKEMGDIPIYTQSEYGNNQPTSFHTHYLHGKQERAFEAACMVMEGYFAGSACHRYAEQQHAIALQLHERRRQVVVGEPTEGKTDG